MMSRLFLLALVIFTTSSYVIAQNQNEPGQTNRKSNRKQASPPQTAKPLEVHISGTVKTEAADSKQQTAKQESAPGVMRPWMTHDELVMSILTFIYVLITFFGLRVLQQQAKIAQIAADAAKASADGLKLGERAWMIPRDPSIGYMPTESGTRNYTYFCKLRNFGKTPALITEVGFEIGIVDLLNHIPQPPKYTRTWPLNKITVAPDDFLYLRREWFASLALDVGQSQAVAEGNLFVYGYGFLRYLDLFSKNDADFRETRFCHCLTGGGFQPCIEAPPEYHRAT